MGPQRVCFGETDEIKQELRNLYKKGKSLWCDGLVGEKRARDFDVIEVVDSSDSEDEVQYKAKKKKASSTCSSLEAKTKRVDTLAKELQEIHKDKYNKIQYKLWAEALDVNKHTSKETPPLGPIWNSAQKKSSKTSSVDAMATAFTHMANSVATAFSPQHTCNSESPLKDASNSCGISISPGRRIDLQEKLLKQIDLIHKMYEKGAITVEQFGKRRDSLLIQLDTLTN